MSQLQGLIGRAVDSVFQTHDYWQIVVGDSTLTLYGPLITRIGNDTVSLTLVTGAVIHEIIEGDDVVEIILSNAVHIFITLHPEGSPVKVC